MVNSIAHGVLILFFILSMSMSIFFVTQLNPRFVSMRVRRIMEFVFSFSFVCIIMVLTFYMIGFIFFVYMPIMVSLVSKMNKRASTWLSLLTPMILAGTLWFYRAWEVKEVAQLVVVLWVVINIICWISAVFKTLRWQIVFITWAFMTVEIVESCFFLPYEITRWSIWLIMIVYIAFGFYIAALAHYTKRNTLFQDEVMYTDELTDLQNYRAFNEFITAPKTQENILLIVMDIDKFKAINDLNGHVIGNEVLKLVVRSVRDVLKIQPHIEKYETFRFGGDEIIIAMWLNHDGAMSEACLRNQFDMVRTIIRQKGRELYHLNVTISAGVSDSRYYDHDLKETFVAADQTLYEVKRAEKNGIAFDQKPK